MIDTTNQDSKTLSILKKVLIEFFILIFVIGFFSKSIVNFFLPKVTTEAVVKSKLETVLEIDGYLEPREILKVRLGGKIIIDEYFKKVGENIKKGDPVFKINKQYGISDINEEIENLEIELGKENRNLVKYNRKLSMNSKNSLIISKEKVKNKKDDLEDTKNLYKFGAVSLSELEKERRELKQLELELKDKEDELREENEDLYFNIKEAENSIERLEAKIKEYRSKSAFYSSIANDGIYYSEINGVILNISNANIVLDEDEPAVNIGKVDKFSSVIFVGHINEENMDMVKLNKTFKIKLEGAQKFLDVRISNIYSVIEDGRLKIEGTFNENVDIDPILGKKYKGKISNKSDDYEYTISKSSIIPDYGELKAGGTGKVFVLEERDGILGKEYISTEARVDIVDVGDKRVAVSGLEGFKEPKVIKNLSFRIKDGERVALWD
ncbi:HlyD family secretion protein [Maledivibacter halophilus]|uniref:Multidrug resistance efflux pump n=1 Tax=Maledivibacter halophilus TaxID=36842 RepID=A0A1T5MHF4_9FIRM|nr:efflux RND transporter periplasmic adaptor subunit [Maledivibacter halophilus]SKC87650.1 hypothetical protein SAMN02194393_04722 [Maledivibacter halophilus]